MTQKPLKITIRRHDRAYLDRLAAQMELPPHAALSWDPVINHLLSIGLEQF